MYLHARYFDPKLGIFLSPDPIGVAGGMNLYGYAFGDPVNGTDRSGLLLDAGLWCFQIVVHDHWTTVCVPTGGGGGGGTTGGGAGTGSNGEKGKGVCTGTCKDEEKPKDEVPPVVTPPKDPEKPRKPCRGPDYYSANVTFQIPFVTVALAAVPVIGEALAATVGVSVQGTLDRGGNVYLGAGPSFGFPPTGFNVQAGRMLIGPDPTAEIPAPSSQRTPAELTVTLPVTPET